MRLHLLPATHAGLHEPEAEALGRIRCLVGKVGKYVPDFAPVAPTPDLLVVLQGCCGLFATAELPIGCRQGPGRKAGIALTRSLDQRDRLVIGSGYEIGTAEPVQIGGRIVGIEPNGRLHRLDGGFALAGQRKHQTQYGVAFGVVRVELHGRLGRGDSFLVPETEG